MLQALESLRQISDGSLDDVEFPNDQVDEIQLNIKKEFVNDSDHINVDDTDIKYDPLDQSKVQVYDLPIKKEKVVKKRPANSELDKLLQEEKYQCQICPAKFVRKMEGYIHLKTEHGKTKRERFKLTFQRTFEIKLSSYLLNSKFKLQGQITCSIGFGITF